MNGRFLAISLVVLFAAILAVAPTTQALAAAPPGPFFQGFEKNTDGWFDASNMGDGILTRQQNGYVSSGYASGIQSAAGRWHARLTGAPCYTPPNQDCTGPFTRWGGYSSTFPSGGYLTQVDVYLDVAWAATHPDVRFDWDSAINDNMGSFKRDWVFNAGTQLLGDVVPGFWVNSSTNAFRSGAFPENPCPNPPSPLPNPCRVPVKILTSGWYTFRHTFKDDGGFLGVDFDIIRRSNGMSVAHWHIQSLDDPMSTVGGNRYGWFANEEIAELPLDNTLRIGACGRGDGDGDFEDRDGHKHHGQFHGDSCDNGGSKMTDDDRDSGKHFESSSVQSSTFTLDEDSQTMTMVGAGLDAGLPVAFTMVIVDFGDVAPALYTLTLTDGRVITGPLVAGSVLLQ